jgi:hypothetical protein
MQINTRHKHILIYLLLCSLFLTSFIGVYNAGSNITPELNALAASSFSGENNQSSMQTGANSRQFGFMANTEASSYLLALKQSQKLLIRNVLDTFVLTAAALIIYAIYSSTLLQKTCTPFNSLQITTFLHKKDGMK